MSSKPDTWMPLYIGDYLSDTMNLTTEQHGAYLLLIMACWKAGGALPADDAQLASIARLSPKHWQAQKPIIAPFFLAQPDCWRHKRIDQELANAQRLSTRGKAGGQASAALRANQIPTTPLREVN